MKKVIIIGCTGSGKSTFAKALHDITKIPLYYLDMLYWKKDMTRVSEEEFIVKLKKVLEEDSYIIDGDYIRTLEMRLDKADTIFFLDYETSVCLEGVRTRTGIKRADLPFIETDAVHNEGFYKHIKDYNLVERQVVLDLLNKYKDKKIIIFKDRLEATNYLDKLKTA